MISYTGTNLWIAEQALRGRGTLNPRLAFHYLFGIATRCPCAPVKEAARRALADIGLGSVEKLRPINKGNLDA